MVPPLAEVERVQLLGRLPPRVVVVPAERVPVQTIPAAEARCWSETQALELGQSPAQWVLSAGWIVMQLIRASEQRAAERSRKVPVRFGPVRPLVPEHVREVFRFERGARIG